MGKHKASEDIVANDTLEFSPTNDGKKKKSKKRKSLATEKHADPGLSNEMKGSETLREKKKRKKFKIFCGNLSEKTTGDELRALFSKHGEVVKVLVRPGRNEIGFVKMDSKENCKAAIEALNGHSLHDYELNVQASKRCEGGRGKSTGDSNKLKIFCGNLSEQTTGDELRALFSKHGEVVEAFVLPARKKFGFVKMDSEENYTAAIEALNGHSLHDYEIKVEAARRHEGNWTCSCGYYNLQYRFECFKCKSAKDGGNKKITLDDK